MTRKAHYIRAVEKHIWVGPLLSIVWHCLIVPAVVVLGSYFAVRRNWISCKLMQAALIHASVSTLVKQEDVKRAIDNEIDDRYELKSGYLKEKQVNILALPITAGLCLLHFFLIPI